MKAQDVLRQGFAGSHGILDQQLADCSPEALRKMFDGSTIHSIGSIYAHTIHSEDAMINGVLQGKPPIWASAGYAAKTGITLPASARQDDHWRDLQIDPAQLKDYAAEVRANTDAYLAGLPDEGLERKGQFFGQEMTVAAVLTTVLLWHVGNHSGEIAALKGVQGLKGLPF